VTRVTRRLRARRPIALIASALLLAAAVPQSAMASPDTLRRSFSNILNGPFDMLLSPIVGGLTLARNIQEIDDSTGVRVAYAVPGWIWLTGLNFGSGGIRILTGALESVPGVLLFPFESDIDPLFDAVEDAGAMVEWDNPIIDIESPWVYYNPVVAPFAIRVKFGISYTFAEM